MGWFEQCGTEPASPAHHHAFSSRIAFFTFVGTSAYFSGSITLLARPGEDFDGGQFVLLEQRPRAQSRAYVLTPPRGAFVIFPTSEHPLRGKNGYYRARMRHGVSTVTRGERTALGVIFHDAK